MRPWKTRWPHHDDDRQIQLQWGHGDEAVEEPAESVTNLTAGRTGFNGATAKRPWKNRRADAWSLRVEDQLQWGHGDEAVERFADSEHRVPPELQPASMGPRR